MIFTSPFLKTCLKINRVDLVWVGDVTMIREW